eukprot:TRINITY_DN51811_c0_g1_i1.p1 TRINITY_DN51811_c0_g1~~TRINITY_DN51811_c0_g1_i1.p1  ORF type:complete len:264 (-),score=19.05 TRINITY_DN51811_c0_g1_i1:299-1063(-)
MDEHFARAEFQHNIPLLMALLAVWNGSCLGFGAYALLPYCQALVRFPAHIQQLEMESNGKRMQIDGVEAFIDTGLIYFGEPGTNAQHSFMQSLHQGTRVVPTEFIGFRSSQNPIALDGENVSNHDELMANFFAQPDALALGRTAEELREDGVPERLIPHKTFPGDRPSVSLLLPICNPFWLGHLLALYEHRTVVQGWIWNINPFDQHGVELGKELGKDVRAFLRSSRQGVGDDSHFVSSTKRLLSDYLKGDPKT